MQPDFLPVSPMKSTHQVEAEADPKHQRQTPRPLHTQTRGEIDEQAATTDHDRPDQYSLNNRRYQRIASTAQGAPCR